VEQIEDTAIIRARSAIGFTIFRTPKGKKIKYICDVESETEIQVSEMTSK
jgi:hypothetical protein